MRALGYCRFAAGDAGREEQRETILAVSSGRGWELEWVDDVDRPADTLRRPGIQTALDLLAGGFADALIASRLDRLTQSALDLAALVERSLREDWALVIVDVGVDTTTAEGHRLATVLATLARFERPAIATRAKEARRVRRPLVGGEERS